MRLALPGLAKRYAVKVRLVQMAKQTNGLPLVHRCGTNVSASNDRYQITAFPIQRYPKIGSLG